MTDDAGAYDLRDDIREIRTAVAQVESLQRDANTRLGKLEGRVFEIEIWRARVQGAAAASRIVWAIAGGAVTALIVEIIQGM